MQKRRQQATTLPCRSDTDLPEEDVPSERHSPKSRSPISAWSTSAEVFRVQKLEAENRRLKLDADNKTREVRALKKQVMENQMLKVKLA